MSETDKISSILKKEKIKDKYGIKRVRVFGSYSRGEQKPGSDMDFLVDYGKPLDIVLFFELKTRLEELFGNKVDLINNKFLKQKFKKYIEKDLITVL